MIVGIIPYEKVISLIDLVVSLHGPARSDLAHVDMKIRISSRRVRSSWLAMVLNGERSIFSG